VPCYSGSKVAAVGGRVGGWRAKARFSRPGGRALTDWRVVFTIVWSSLPFPRNYRCPHLGPVAKDSHEEDLAASISVKPRHLASDIPTTRAFFDVHALLVDAVVGRAEDAWVVPYLEQRMRYVFDPLILY
jgi:hypothetical protein